MRSKLYRSSVLLVLGGLGLVLITGLYKWDLSKKADALLADGRPVTATVVDFRIGQSGRASGADWMEVAYTYEGRTYRDRVRCGGFTGCVQEPNANVVIRVDPKDPAEFVMPDGNATGSLFILTSWTLIPGGLFFAAVGGVVLFVLIKDDWRRKRLLDGGANEASGSSGELGNAA